MIVFDVLYSMFTNKCTRCHKGDVFVEKNPYKLGSMFKMHKTCSHCNLKYEKELDFFYGAMYVSYALTSGWFIIWFMLQTYVLKWNIYSFIIFFFVFIVLTAPLNLRWARLIWLYFFFPYKKESEETEKQQMQKNEIL